MMGGIVSLITVGKACPEQHAGNNTAAVIPISVIPIASGTSNPAVQKTDFLATRPSLAEKIRSTYPALPHTLALPAAGN